MRYNARRLFCGGWHKTAGWRTGATVIAGSCLALDSAARSRRSARPAIPAQDGRRTMGRCDRHVGLLKDGCRTLGEQHDDTMTSLGNTTWRSANDMNMRDRAPPRRNANARDHTSGIILRHQAIDAYDSSIRPPPVSLLIDQRTRSILSIHKLHSSYCEHELAISIRIPHNVEPFLFFNQMLAACSWLPLSTPSCDRSLQ
jgi:hypothetical protein